MAILDFFLKDNTFIQVLTSLFLAILFLQSGVDKVTDWAGNLSWLKGHFSNSPLKNMVPVMLGTIMILELATGALCGIGVFQILVAHEKSIALLGAQLAVICITMLFFGQRIAKDYPGAATLANYFILTILAVLLLS
jgi:putative oxidoreductase